MFIGNRHKEYNKIRRWSVLMPDSGTTASVYTQPMKESENKSDPVTAVAAFVALDNGSAKRK